MIIKTEISLKDFEFWSGAKALAERLTPEEFEKVEEALEELNPDGIDETELNDIFWHDDNWVCKVLELDIDEIYNR